MSLSRRALVIGAAIASVLPWPQRRTISPVGPAADPAMILTGIVDRNDAAAIGRAYLAGGRSARSASDLSAGLARRLGLATDIGVSNATLAHSIAMQCRREFAAGDVVNIRDWLLARTEAELCALAALTVGTDRPIRQPA